MGDKVKLGFKNCLKIYILLFIYLMISTLIYTAYINKTNNDFNLIIKLIIGGIAYLLLGFLYANIIHKKGLIVGILVGIIHYFIIQIIIFLINNIFNFQLLPFIIYLLSTAIGGLLGVNIKKLF